MSLKSLVLTALIFVALPSFAKESTSLDLTGFSLLHNSDSAMELKFRDQAPFVISKFKFAAPAYAAAFCANRGMELDPNGIETVFLIAMSGAALVNAEIKNAITFNFAGALSGLWAWSGDTGNIVLMIDGRGTETQLFSLNELKSELLIAGISTPVSLPAICK